MHNTTTRQALFWLAMATPVAIHFSLLAFHAVNAPRLDDFSEVLTFLPDFYASNSWQEKMRAFFAVYQDHRYGVTHLFNLLTSGINFREYVLWGNTLLIGYCALVWHCLRQHPLQKTLTLSALLLIFNLHAWTGMYWASILLTSLGSLPVALGCFMLVCGDKRLLPAAAIAALCLTYTLGNGILVWPLALVYCLLENRQKQRPVFDWRALFWLMAGITVASCYFSEFNFFNREGQGGTSATSLLSRSLDNAPAIILGFFSLAGSLLLHYSGQTDWRIYVSACIGLMECLAISILVWRGALREKPALLMLLAFVLLTMLAIATARSSVINLGQSLQGHYKLYTSTLTLLLVIAHIDWLYQHKPLQAIKLANIYAGIAALLYVAALFLFRHDIPQYHKELATDTRNWLYSNNLQRTETRLFVKNPNAKLLRAAKGGYYDPWSLITADQKPAHTEKLENCRDAGYALTDVDIHSQKLAMAVHISARWTNKVDQLFLCSPQQSLRISLTDTQVKAEKNGTYSIELWVPRDTDIREDEGPWQVYLPR
jgi:hypothetical protein